jgi:CBS domain-containing protein
MTVTRDPVLANPRARDVMTSPAITIEPDANYEEAVDLLLRNDISGLPVVDRGNLVGMVTEADLVSKGAYGWRRRRPLALLATYLRGEDPQWVRKASGTLVRDVMSPTVLSVAADDDLRSVARHMLLRGVKRVPVVEFGQVVGVLSRRDLLALFTRADQDIAADVAKLLSSPITAPDGHEAAFSVVDGVVTLTGTTDKPSDIHLIETIVGAIPGVVSIDDRLTARHPEPDAR